MVKTARDAQKIYINLDLTLSFMMKTSVKCFVFEPSRLTVAYLLP